MNKKQTCLILLIFAVVYPELSFAGWVSVGPGGGGAMYSPASSPHDAGLLFVSCDMGGFYRSTDGGKTWRMVDQQQIRGSTHCRPVFHPLDPDTVYTCSSGALKRSNDRGETWSNHWLTPGGTEILELAIDPGNPDLMFAGFDGSVYRSDDGGGSWSAAAGVTGLVTGFYIDMTTPVSNRAVLAGSSDGIFRSSDDGRNFSSLVSTDAHGLAGGTVGTTGPRAVFYIDSSGIYRSTDTLTFDLVKDASGDDLGFVSMAQNQVSSVYVTSDAASIPSRYEAVYRSLSGGDPGTWENCFRGHPGLTDPNVDVGWITLDITWGWGGPAIGFNVNPSHPETAMFTDTGRTFMTTDSGTSWHQVYSRFEGSGLPAADQPWSSIGLEVTSCYHYDFDPFDRTRTYISYTDIGFSRSLDRGNSWFYSTDGSPWRNTFYQIALDEAVPGVMYAACSNKHDIPFWSSVGSDADTYPGGVCKSMDYGQTWTDVSSGLPLSPATSIVIDPADHNTLYVTMYGNGVYKSLDGAGTWVLKNKGLDIPSNSHVYSIQIHNDGTVFCAKTGYRFSSNDFFDNSGLWKSNDGGENWISCNGTIDGITPGESWAWAIDFSVDPRNSQVIYLGAFDCTFGRVQGGIYKTSDGGATWARKKQFYRVFYPYLHPADPDTIILTTPESGVWKSEDSGNTWTELTGIPFRTTIRAALDPEDYNILYVTTFGGGVWKYSEPVVPVNALALVLPLLIVPATSLLNRYRKCLNRQVKT